MRMDQETSFIAERAAEWLAELEDAGNRRRADFWKWLNASPAHVQEALLATACDTVLTHLFRDRETGPDPVMACHSNIHELDRQRPGERSAADRLGEDRRDMGDDAQSSTDCSPRARSLTVRLVAAIATVTLAVLLGLMIKVAWWDRTLITHAGEWKTHALADGSTMRMGPHTTVRIDLGDRRRVVQLVRGEAVFEVAHDARRPFLVRSDHAVVRAIGTKFGLAALEGRLHVTVAEGAVAVSRGNRVLRDERASADVADAASAAGGLRLAAGEQVIVDEHAPLAIRRVNARAALAWAERWIFCEDHTVAEVARELNRRNRQQIELADAVLGAEYVNGILRLDDPEAFAAMIARSLPDIAVEAEADVLRLERRADRVIR